MPIPPPTGGPVLDPMLPLPLQTLEVSLAAGTLTYRTTAFPAGMKVRARVAFENGEGVGTWTAWSNTVTVGPTVLPPIIPVAPDVAPSTPAVEDLSYMSLGIYIGPVIRASWSNAGYSQYAIDGAIERSSYTGLDPLLAGPGTFAAYQGFAVNPGYIEALASLNPGEWIRVRIRFLGEGGFGPWTAYSTPVRIVDAP